MSEIEPVGSPLEQIQAMNPFDAIKQTGSDGKTEFWWARQLMELLGYDTWRRFAEAIERGKLACTNAGMNIDDHFRPWVLAGGDKNYPEQGGRPREDYGLTRHACYLVAMNGDPRKPEIAAAQTYFAVRTREAELARPQLPPTYADALRALADQVERAEGLAEELAIAAPKAAIHDAIEAQPAGGLLGYAVANRLHKPPQKFWAWLLSQKSWIVEYRCDVCGRPQYRFYAERRDYCYTRPTRDPLNIPPFPPHHHETVIYKTTAIPLILAELNKWEQDSGLLIEDVEWNRKSNDLA